MNYHKSNILIKVLGAGQTVGRSCVIVELENRRVMFDCGCHLGYKDERKYPNFGLLVGESEMNESVELNESIELNESDEIVNTQGEKEEEKEEEEKEEPTTNAIKDGIFSGETEIEVEVINSTLDDRDKLVNQMKRINEIIDCVIISHFHMDHVGALPFFTELLMYNGPVIMSYPTKALSPILLLDGCRVNDMKWEKKNFERKMKMLNDCPDKLLAYHVNSVKKDPWNISEENIHNCINKVIGLQLNETYELGNLKITPYYAGHVLGACIFKIEVNQFSVIYTGDYNTTPDKHLGSAKIPTLVPEILISESTYASYIRPPRKLSELDLCTLVHECVNKGGKVLIPVFATGRAQELSILLDDYWEKMQISVPIYFGCGLTESANRYYKIYSSWTSSSCIDCTDQSTKGLGESNENAERRKMNLFNFKRISPFMQNYLYENRPMVLFATPGMLHTGLALKAFKSWAPNSNNLVILPGYCVQGTVGHKLIMGEKKIYLDASTCIQVLCKIIYLSFSSHVDSNGIQQLIKHSLPKTVVFVHGEKTGMEKLAKFVQKQHSIYSVCPALGQRCEFLFEKQTFDYVYVHRKILKKSGITLKNKKNIENPQLTSIPFNALLFVYCKRKTFVEKNEEANQIAYFEFIPKKVIISYLRKQNFNVKVTYSKDPSGDEKSVDSNILFGEIQKDGSSIEWMKNNENKINKKRKRNEKKENSTKRIKKEDNIKKTNLSKEENENETDHVKNINQTATIKKENEEDHKEIDQKYISTPNIMYSQKKNLPILNIRFKEHISIKYKTFYNFVLTFLKKIMSTNDKKQIRFLGKKVIIKNIKYDDMFFLLLSFHSLRAIHDGNHLLILEWSYIDDTPNSTVKKFIDSLLKYIQE